jgi:uncharacterized protein YecT (DUF1311 family)
MPDNAMIATSQPRASFKTRVVIFVVLALVLSGGIAHAQNATELVNAGVKDTRASYAVCLKAAAGVTPDMKQCMGTEYAYQDKRLNVAYRALMVTLGKDQRAKLRSEERAWIAYRDSHCALDPNGGQAAELDAYDCSVQETSRQASALEDRLHKEH